MRTGEEQDEDEDEDEDEGEGEERTCCMDMIITVPNVLGWQLVCGVIMYVPQRAVRYSPRTLQPSAGRAKVT